MKFHQLSESDRFLIWMLAMVVALTLATVMIILAANLTRDTRPPCGTGGVKTVLSQNYPDNYTIVCNNGRTNP